MGTNHTTQNQFDVPTVRGSLNPQLSAEELTDWTAINYPLPSLTDGGNDYDKTPVQAVQVLNGSAERVLSHAKRPGIHLVAVRLNMTDRTLNMREYPTPANAYTVPVAEPYRPNPDANPLPGLLTCQTLSRAAFAFSRWLNSRGFALRCVSVANSYRLEPVAVFTSLDDAQAYAQAVGRPVYDPSGQTVAGYQVA